MSNTKSSALVISQRDYQHLLQLIEKNTGEAADVLDAEISRANIVAQEKLPADVVAMESQVTFTDLDSGEAKTVQLVYPQDADVGQMKISILSPVGSALIGLKVGGCIEWPVPQGKKRRLQVVAVVQ